MIAVTEALDKIVKASQQQSTEHKSVDEAHGFVLAMDVLSPIHMPPFDQSAMDGYALNFHEDIHEYHLLGEIKAGDPSKFDLSPGQAVRIFTGGMVPSGANTVAKQEIVDRTADNTIQFTEAISLGMNIRPTGEQIEQGQLAIQRGTVLNAGAIGFLATLGITELTVFSKPSIAVITTGNELAAPGSPLQPGQIYESNSSMIRSALQSIAYSCTVDSVKDTLAETKAMLSEALDQYDILIVTGGISVGDYDFVGKALLELGVEEVFYKIRQKPGKPMFFGKKDSQLIFALPGNPAAALTCLYVYVFESLYQRMGHTQLSDRRMKATLADNYSKTTSLTHFLKGHYANGNVTILHHQSSAMLDSFVGANCLVIAEQNRADWNAGDVVELILLPTI